MRIAIQLTVIAGLAMFLVGCGHAPSGKLQGRILPTVEPKPLPFRGTMRDCIRYGNRNGWTDDVTLLRCLNRS